MVGCAGGAVGREVSQSPGSFPRSLPIQVAVLLHLRSSMVLMNSTAAVNCIHQ